MGSLSAQLQSLIPGRCCAPVVVPGGCHCGKDMGNYVARLRPKHKRGTCHSGMDVDSSSILALEEYPARFEAVITARETLDRFGPPVSISRIASYDTA
jgi:hypothetical protein